MNTKLFFLKIALVVIGLTFIFGIYPLMSFWPSGWRWIPHQTEYEQMILGVYATLGIFLLKAARNPLENRSLIWFTAWSSIVHAGIMLIQAIVNPEEHAHLYGDVPALFIIGLVIFLLMPRSFKDVKES